MLDVNIFNARQTVTVQKTKNVEMVSVWTLAFTSGVHQVPLVRLVCTEEFAGVPKVTKGIRCSNVKYRMKRIRNASTIKNALLAWLVLIAGAKIYAQIIYVEVTQDAEL